MNFLIRRLVTVAGDRQGHQDREVVSDRLTIGRGTDQDLLLRGDRVAYQHAEIVDRGGRVELRARAATGVTVNGHNSSVAVLTEGDQILIGDYRLVVIRPPAEHIDFAFTLEQLQPPQAETLEESQFVTGPERIRWLRKRPWAWIGFLALLLFGLGLPSLVAWQHNDHTRQALRATPLFPDDHVWTVGAMSRAHQFIGEHCEKCHTQPFHRVPNSACESCHKNMSRHVAAVSGHPKVAGGRCAHCHQEHNGQTGVIIDDQKFCTSCHGDIKSFEHGDTDLRNVHDFGRDHPDFRITLLRLHFDDDKPVWTHTGRLTNNDQLREQSNLIFSHAVHLRKTGVENETGAKEVMHCSDCHRPDAGGAGMKPISMKEHCSRCHALSFDKDHPQRVVPHGNVQAVMDSLRDYYSRRFLEERGGMKPGELDMPGAKPPVDRLQAEGVAWVQKQTRRTARDIFERQVCKTCHKVSREDTGDGPVWSVAPVRINRHYWFHSARFDHAAHRQMDCGECHKAKTSKHASDVLMPHIKECRTCHTGAFDSKGLRSTCITCHRFHYAQNGKLEAAR